jgi:signal transduction histidine kinase
VSHELRNPLNSIIAQNIEKESFYEDLQGIYEEFRRQFYHHDYISPFTKQVLDFIGKILLHLREGLKAQQSSAEMMTYMVQDLLDFAQIKAGKFRKNCKRFNIRKAIENVMLVQKKKAIEQNLQFYATFENVLDPAEEFIDQEIITG